MYLMVIYAMTIIGLCVVVYKGSKNRSEWLFWLTSISYTKSILAFLFAGTSVITLFTLGSTQVHVDDVILIIAFLAVLCYIIKPFPNSFYFKVSLLVLLPISVSLCRGLLNGSILSTGFLNDIRKYFFFMIMMYAVYFGLRTAWGMSRIDIISKCVHNMMNLVLVYILVVWICDLGLGINTLPGQLVGIQSDGGSTFRIVAPSQVLMIALYTLYTLREDIEQSGVISLKAILFTIVIVLLQWRTVVFSFLLGFIMILLLYSRKSTISKKLLGEIAVIAVAAIVYISSAGEANTILSMFENLFGSFSSIVEGTGTFSTRTNVWKAMLDALTGINTIIGLPFGDSLGIRWTASAHSGYIDYIVKMGYVGVVCFGLFVISLITKSIKNRESMILIVLVVLCSYWIGYGFTMEQGAIIGFIMAVLENDENYLERQEI